MEIVLKTPLKEKIIICGFPGVGLVGPIVCRHIVERRKMRFIGFVRGNVPLVVGVERGKVRPAISIYGDEDFVVIYSDVYFDDDFSGKLASKLIEHLVSHHAKMLVSVAGIITGGDEPVYGICSREGDLSFLERAGVVPVKRGTTTGISAALLLEGFYRDFPVFLVLGHLHTREDFRAAASVVEKLDRMFNIGVDVRELLSEAKRIEGEISEILRQRKECEMYG